MKYNKRALRRICIEKGIWVADLAIRAKISRGNVQYIEKGMSVPTAVTLAKLMTALEVGPSAFFLEESKAP